MVLRMAKAPAKSENAALLPRETAASPILRTAVKTKRKSS